MDSTLDPIHQALQVPEGYLAQQQEQLTSLCTDLREMAARQDSMMTLLGTQFSELLSHLPREVPAAAISTPVSLPGSPMDLQPPASAASPCPQLSRPEQFPIPYRTLAAESEWNPTALTDAFFKDSLKP